MGVSLIVTAKFKDCEVTDWDFAAMFAVIVLLFIARSTLQAMWLKAELDSKEELLRAKQEELDQGFMTLDKQAQKRAHQYAALQQAEARARNAEGIADGLRARFAHDPDTSVVCKICFDRPASCALLPCKHLGFCRICATEMTSGHGAQRRCPLCRSQVVAIFEGFPA